MISEQQNGHFVSRKFLRETEKTRNLYPARPVRAIVLELEIKDTFRIK